jgi:hypothetical protein
MKSIDYENMFIYMSLVFAFCIFIILLYGCAFASASRGGGDSQIYENFLNEDDKGDIKSQVVSLLTELEGKDTTSADDKKKLSDALEKINNNNISITELKAIIDLLKEMMPKTVSKKSAATAKAPATDTAKSPTAPSSATAATAATDTAAAAAAAATAPSTAATSATSATSATAPSPP